MANRTAQILAQMFTFGIHRSIITNSPVNLLFPPGGTENACDRALTDDESFMDCRTLHSRKFADEH
jgi:hypothetical protein